MEVTMVVYSDAMLVSYFEKELTKLKAMNNGDHGANNQELIGKVKYVEDLLSKLRSGAMLQ